ncbi:MAG TPA: hypothetical protein VMU67_00905 [Steroidobacteraceae bacterium]|nr:hypothetical protein [Steroidobacteraceae bacterium]
MIRNASKHGTLERTYFVHGHRVEERRDGAGRKTLSCECGEYARSRSSGEPWCVHAQRVAAAVSIDELLGSDGLILRPTVC